MGKVCKEIGSRVNRVMLEIKQQVPLSEYLLWWALRAVLFAGGVWSIFHMPEATFEMFISVVFTFAVTLLHILFKKLWPGKVPINLQTIAIIFLVVTSFCGKLLNFYYTIPWWDMVIHAMGGALCVFVGYCIVTALNAKQGTKLSPVVSATWGFCFAFLVALVWELMEFSFDSFTGGDSQHWMMNPNSSNFELFSITMDPEKMTFFTVDARRYALLDTTTDMTCGTVGAIVGYIFMWTKLHREKLREDGVIKTKKRRLRWSNTAQEESVDIVDVTPESTMPVQPDVPPAPKMEQPEKEPAVDE